MPSAPHFLRLLAGLALLPAAAVLAADPPPLPGSPPMPVPGSTPVPTPPAAATPAPKPTPLSKLPPGDMRPAGVMEFDGFNMKSPAGNEWIMKASEQAAAKCTLRRIVPAGSTFGAYLQTRLIELPKDRYSDAEFAQFVKSSVVPPPDQLAQLKGKIVKLDQKLIKWQGQTAVEYDLILDVGEGPGASVSKPLRVLNHGIVALHPAGRRTAAWSVYSERGHEPEVARLTAGQMRDLLDLVTLQKTISTVK